MAPETAGVGLGRPAGDAPRAAVAPPGGREALERLRRFGGDALVRDMAAIFLADMPERLARARVALARRDVAAVAYAAHTMKSSAAQFGAGALAALCGEAERAAHAGAVHALPTLVERMASELDGFRGWLERELAIARGGE
jgi:HPt (histidine-containing phosphotransfer) domain-containing protein